jgi:hypothetical protein
MSNRNGNRQSAIGNRADAGDSIPGSLDPLIPSDELTPASLLDGEDGAAGGGEPNADAAHAGGEGDGEGDVTPPNAPAADAASAGDDERELEVLLRIEELDALIEAAGDPNAEVQRVNDEYLAANADLIESIRVKKARVGELKQQVYSAQEAAGKEIDRLAALRREREALSATLAGPQAAAS